MKKFLLLHNKRQALIGIMLMLSMNMVISQETFKIMFYNVLNFPDQGPVNRIDNLAYILQDYQPDIFMICELNNEQGANDILGVLQTLKPSYSKANFVLNTSDDADGDQNFLQNIIFYDSSKFILNAQFEVTTIFRDFNHYILKLNTVDQVANPIILNAIVCHLKSSSGTVNQALRLQMVNDLTTYLDGLSSDELVLLGGDLNLYTQSEAAFQELIDPSNNITFTDPANRIGSWSNNLVYLDVFTQSTRTQSGLGGATGGFDDRFDFILTSENLAADPDLFYVPNSYQVFGNNGNNNCYNQEINSFNCSGPEFDFTIRDALYYMSDHLPVTLELQTNESLLNITEFVTTPSYRFINGNLVEETVELAIESNVNQLKNVTVYNVYGQRMAQLEMDALNHLKFDVSNWSSGIYYITFPNRQIKPLKFIKK